MRMCVFVARHSTDAQCWVWETKRITVFTSKTCDKSSSITYFFICIISFVVYHSCRFFSFPTSFDSWGQESERQYHFIFLCLKIDLCAKSKQHTRYATPHCLPSHSKFDVRTQYAKGQNKNCQRYIYLGHFFSETRLPNRKKRNNLEIKKYIYVLYMQNDCYG